MKKIISILMIIIPTLIFSQSGEGIEIAPNIEQNDEISPSLSKILENKLGNLLTKNGIIKGVNSQFQISTDVQILNSQSIDGAVPTIMYEIEFTTNIKNSIDNNTFSQISTVAKGMGDTKQRAIVNAVNKMNFNTPEYNQFLSAAKSKIVNYYNANCNQILQESDMLSKTNQYDYALYKLTSVPPVAKKCYATAMSKAQNIYIAKINYDCKTNLATAKNIWNANPSVDGANEAASYLSQINPTSSCYKEADNFSKTISARVKEIDGREWKVTYEQEVGLEKDRIQAMKEIGKAYGAGQPKQVIHNNKIKL